MPLKIYLKEEIFKYKNIYKLNNNHKTDIKTQF